jgi:hypothetical protein
MHGPGPFAVRLLLAAGLALGTASPAYAAPAAAGSAAAVLEPLRVVPGGQEATVDLRASEPVAVQVDYHPAQAEPAITPDRIGVLHAAGAGGGGPFNTLTDGNAFAGPAVGMLAVEPYYATAHHLKLPGLTPATAYTLTVRATDRAGQETVAGATFTTLKRRVRIALREITVQDDGDLIGDGEPLWTVGVTWAGGAVSGCFPNTDNGLGGVCQPGEFGAERLFPRNNHGQVLTWLFAEENFDRFPESFTLTARVDEADWPFVPCAPCDFGGLDPHELALPRGVEWASTPVYVRANDSDVQSTLAFTFDLFHDHLSYPAQRNAPASTWRSPFGS